jgi:hypothetical protein
LLHRCGFWEEGAAGQSRLRLVSRKTQKFGREAESRRRGQMSYTREVLDDVRAQLAPEDTVIKEARERRDASKAAGESFPGALRSYNSGSLAHGTANCPVHQRDKGLDADCGVVLDRRAYPTLGPDVFGGEGPVEIVEEMRLHVLGELRRDYPKVEAETTKRAILLTFHEPFRDGEDPTVDLVVGLTRRDAPGLWIPNTERDTWDPSDPEKHTELLTSGGRELRRSRAHAIRLAKAENKRTSPAPLCSFNVEAFGWMFVEAGESDPEALLALWRRGADDLSQRFTPDPAGVSAPIKVEDMQLAVDRLSEAADRLERALARDWDTQYVREQLQPLWPDFINITGDQAATKARLAAAIKSKSNVAVTTTGALTTGAGLRLKQSRSYGNG